MHILPQIIWYSPLRTFIQMWHLLEIEGVHHLSVSVVFGLSPLDRSSGILEPVNDVVDVQRLLPLPGLEPIEDADVLLHLEAGRVIVLGKPGLKLRDLVFRIKANPHPRLVLVTHISRRFHLDFSLQILKSMTSFQRKKINRTVQTSLLKQNFDFDSKAW